MNKKQLSEQDICTKYITPALEKAGWDVTTQVREEFPLTKGRIIVRGKLHTRAKHKRADYVLFCKPNIPIAIIEAKDNNHTVGDGMQQALGYADMLQVPFVFSSNGDSFLFHSKIASDGLVERELALHEFPAAETLWQWWAQHRGLHDQQNALVTQDHFSDGSDRSPRYYQLLAINKTIEAIARGQNRILLVMATGKGKTFTAFQIIWRLWKSKAKERIQLLADRNILVDQTMTNDFKPRGSAMTRIQKRQATKSYEIHLSLYQAVTGNEEEKNIYRQFSPDFFDLVVRIDLDRDLAGWRPDKGTIDKYGNEIEDRIPFFSVLDLDEVYNNWNQLGQNVQTDPCQSLVKKHNAHESYAMLLPVPANGKIRNQVINPHTGGNYGNRSLLTIELLFHGVPGLDQYFVVDTARTDGFIEFVSDGQKVAFPKDVVPTLAPACFEVFRPMFEFIKSKCPAGAEGEEVAP